MSSMRNNHFDVFGDIARRFADDMNQAREENSAVDPVKIFLGIQGNGITEKDKIAALNFFREFTDQFSGPGVRLLFERKNATPMERTENNIRRLEMAEYGEPLGLVTAIRDAATKHIRLTRGPQLKTATDFYMNMISAVCDGKDLSTCMDLSVFDKANEMTKAFCENAAGKIKGRVIRTFAELEKMGRSAEPVRCSFFSVPGVKKEKTADRSYGRAAGM